MIDYKYESDVAVNEIKACEVSLRAYEREESSKLKQVQFKEITADPVFTWYAYSRAEGVDVGTARIGIYEELKTIDDAVEELVFVNGRGLTAVYAEPP